MQLKEKMIANPAQPDREWFFSRATSCRLAALAQLACIFALVCLLTAVRAFASDNEAPAAKVAYGLDFAKTDTGWELTVKFDGRPDTRVFLMDTPSRLVLEIRKSVFNLKDDLPPEASLEISDIRFGAVTSETSRLVVTLKEPHAVITKSLKRIDDSSRHYLTITMNPVAPEAFAKLISGQQELLGTSGEAVVKGDRVRAGPRKPGTFSIVIDPGHGGIDGGAVGNTTDVREKELVLVISRMIGDRISASGNFEVSYTRTEDVFVSLKERQRFARRQKADLMLSIHADSLKQKYVRGATVYTLAKRATDSLSRQLAASENLADVVAGLAAPESRNDVTDILADLTMRETTRFSRGFAAILVNHLRPEIRMIKNPLRAAAFAVLKNAEVPGVLIELGYLSNSEDEEQLSDPDWQKRVSALIADAVIEFFSTRRPQVTAN